VDYTAKHPNLTRDFVVDDRLMNEFKTYVDSNRNFKYSIPGKTSLDRFRETIKREGYDGQILALADSLEKMVDSQRNKDFWDHSEVIKRILKREIASASFGSRERTIASKEWDVQLQKAIEVLNNPQRYTSILSPNGVKTGQR
jgi:carboxyl-terminal processing protease